jgi:integrase
MSAITAEEDTKDDMLELIYKKKLDYYSSLPTPRTIKKTTVKQQLTKVRNLYKTMIGGDKFDLSFLKEKDDVIKYINEKYKTAESKNTNIQAIASILQVMPEYKKEYEYYSKYSTEARQDITKDNQKNLMTEKEKENLISWPKILELTNKNMDSLSKVITSIYTLIPPRRAQAIGDLVIGDKENMNSILLNKNNIPTYIVFRDYKTAKTYGDQKFRIPCELGLILSNYIEEYELKPGQPLFPTRDGKPYKNFSEMVSNVFKKETGKKLTVNLLRHAYVSNLLKSNPSKEQLIEASEKLAHSLYKLLDYNRVEL